MNPYRVKTKVPAAARAQADSLRAARVDVKGFCSKYFNDTDYLEKEYGLWKFELDLRSVILDFQCLDEVPADRFQDVFTPEELFAIWEVWNFNGYLSMGRSPMTDNKGCLSTAAILRDMIECADRDLASGDINLSLRFSHDIAILPLLSYMKLDNFGAVLTDPSDVKNWWRIRFRWPPIFSSSSTAASVPRRFSSKSFITATRPPCRSRRSLRPSIPGPPSRNITGVVWCGCSLCLSPAKALFPGQTNDITLFLR